MKLAHKYRNALNVTTDIRWIHKNANESFFKYHMSKEVNGEQFRHTYFIPFYHLTFKMVTSYSQQGELTNYKHTHIILL